MPIAERSLRASLVFLTVAACLVAAPRARAACNLIPQAQKLFRGALGSTDRPFATPGDFVELDVRSALCDGASAGFTAAPGNHVVTLVFTPPSNGPRRAVVLTTDCASNAPAAALTACGTLAKGGATCIEVNHPGAPVGLDVVPRADGNHLRFRFPTRTPSSPPAATATRSRARSRSRSRRRAPRRRATSRPRRARRSRICSPASTTSMPPTAAASRTSTRARS